MSQLEEIFHEVKYSSVKYNTYFNVYEHIFQKYIGQEITFVEVGVLDGGSLFMWRKFLGPQARIIGIDLNPAALKWNDYGFEIFIGSQSDPQFWQDFYKTVGSVDVLLDDGGHTNRQQIVTTAESIHHVKNGGVLVVEDVHSSYMATFGNPSKYSFINFSKKIIDSINSRYHSLQKTMPLFKDAVYSVEFFESFVVFNIDRLKCIESVMLKNNGETMNAADFRYEKNYTEVLFRKLSRRKYLDWIPVIGQIKQLILWFLLNRYLSKYFK
jgi:hypothetical protein